MATRGQTAKRGRSAKPRSRQTRQVTAQRRPTAAVRRRRRLVLFAGVLLIGGGVGLAVSELDFIEDTLREVTLPLRHDDIIRQEAADKGVDADLIAAVIYAESRFVDQTSEAGARGLMQITPDTARYIENLSGGETFRIEDLAVPDINIAYGTYYLEYLLDRYGGNEVAAVAAYNAGETKVDEWGGADIGVDQIQFDETRNYVAEVLDKREDYREHYAEDLGL
jgi:soluble lytic murein transglycosylase